MSMKVVYENVVTAVFDGTSPSYRKMSDLIDWIEEHFEAKLVTASQSVIIIITEHVGTTELLDELMENYLDHLLSFELRRQVQRA
jgi:hypothetical protein